MTENRNLLSSRALPHGCPALCNPDSWVATDAGPYGHAPAGHSGSGQSILHQPDEPSRQEQMPYFGWGRRGDTSMTYTFVSASSTGRTFEFAPGVTQGRFFWLK